MNAHQTPLHGLRVLIIEDMIMVADELTRMVSELGCIPVGAVGSVREALGAVKNQKFDAALLDLNLHDELAYDVADALLDRRLPFIFMSGYGHGSIEAPFHIYPHLEKPFTKAELQQMMESVFVHVHS